MDLRLKAIDKQAAAPLSQQIAHLVQANIETGVLRPGQRLPTERELAARLGVARGTVKAAYKILADENAVYTRQGSGSYVADGAAGGPQQLARAQGMVQSTVESLRVMGLRRRDIAELVRKNLPAAQKEAPRIAVVAGAPELLAEWRRQLETLPGVSATVFILDSIVGSAGAEALLSGFSLVVVAAADYPAVAAAAPGLAGRMVKVAAAPDEATLAALTALPRTSRVGIICRSNVFLGVVKSTLLAFGFKEKNISSYFEMDYTTKTYFPGGIDLLVSFRDAHIFTNPEFGFRNDEFGAKGGVIVPFVHRLDAGSMLAVEELLSGFLC